jgi:hypothetical protein
MISRTDAIDLDFVVETLDELRNSEGTLESCFIADLAIVMTRIWESFTAVDVKFRFKKFQRNFKTMRVLYSALICRKIQVRS